jgi:hypothetical protein
MASMRTRGDERHSTRTRQEAEMRADGRLTDDAMVIRVQFVKPTNPEGGVDEPLQNCSARSPSC